MVMKGRLSAKTLMEEGRLQVHGHRVDYLVWGKDRGVPLVLLHGDGESPRDWLGVAPQLAARRSLIAISLPGQGGSEPINDLSPPAQAAWLADVLDVLGLDRVVLVGHSLGGLVSLYLTLAQSQRIDRLVLIGSSGLGHAVSPLLAIVSIPWLGEAWIALPLLPGGPYVRAAIRASVLFAQPWHAPAEWWLDQVRMGADRSYL